MRWKIRGHGSLAALPRWGDTTRPGQMASRMVVAVRITESCIKPLALGTMPAIILHFADASTSVRLLTALPWLRLVPRLRRPWPRLGNPALTQPRGPRLSRPGPPLAGLRLTQRLRPPRLLLSLHASPLRNPARSQVADPASPRPIRARSPLWHRPANPADSPLRRPQSNPCRCQPHSLPCSPAVRPQDSLCPDLPVSRRRSPPVIPPLSRAALQLECPLCNLRLCRRRSPPRAPAASPAYNRPQLQVRSLRHAQRAVLQCSPPLSPQRNHQVSLR